MGTVPGIWGLVWLRFRPNSCSKSKISGRILTNFRGPPPPPLPSPLRQSSSLVYPSAIVPPGRKSGFRAAFRPDSTRDYSLRPAETGRRTDFDVLSKKCPQRDQTKTQKQKSQKRKNRRPSPSSPAPAPARRSRLGRDRRRARIGRTPSEHRANLIREPQ